MGERNIHTITPQARCEEKETMEKNSLSLSLSSFGGTLCF